MRKQRAYLFAAIFLAGLAAQALPAGLVPAPQDGGSDAAGDAAEAAQGGAVEAPPAAPDGGAGKKVLLLELKGVIDLGLAPFLRRSLKRGGEYAAVVIEIDTPGGRVDAALQIRDALIESKARTVAFIHPRAISAGALIAYACDTIAVSTGGTMGAATPVAIAPGGGATAVDEKMVSYFRAEMASTAKANGRRGDIAEAMVDKDVAIEGVIEAGKLLTLDADRALALGVADHKADSLGGLLAAIGLGGAAVEKPAIGWAEQIARWLTHPVFSGLLMSIGVLGIMIELYTPGFGAPGIVGIVCLALFFFGHVVARLAGWEEAALAVVGVALIAVEVFAAPGHVLPGAIGALCLVTALTLALVSLPLKISFSTGMLRGALVRTILSLGGAIALFLLLVKLLPRFSFSNPIVDRSALTKGSFDADAPAAGTGGARPPAAGDRGVAGSPLRPAGRGILGGRAVDVLAEGELIDEGAAIEVVRTEGGKIIVRKA